MKFSEILAQITPNAEQSIQLPAGWGQGRALFGGVTAAVAWQHAQHGVDDTKQLRSLTVSFVSPVQPGEVQLQRRVLREGSNVTQVAVELLQNGATVLSCLASFGRSRASTVAVVDVKKPDIPSREKGLSFPPVDILPEFTSHFDYVVTVGGLPFTGNKSREFGGWMRFSRENVPMNIGFLLGMVDAWPPALLPHLVQPAPASSLCWTIEFPEAFDANLRSSDWWQYVAHIDYAADGYGHTHTHIWDKDGDLVAISRQTVTVFG